MLYKAISILLLVGLLNPKAGAQCTTLGQTPATAFPVCGTSTFRQDDVPVCTNGNLPASACGFFPDINPFYYAFTCFSGGTLDFELTPQDLNDDYDWQLFDVTNAANVNDIFNDASLFVVGNWSGTYGKTGTAPGNIATIVCYSDPGKTNPFSQPPQLQTGHKYLLVISHFTPSQSGYTLSFGGGGAVITDKTAPKFKTATANCGGTKVGIKLSKNIKCTSLDAGGTDFSLATPLAKITAAAGSSCGANFDADSLELTLNNPLPPGTYKIFCQNGKDGNTLLDDCDNELPAGDSIQFTVYAVAPTPMDSLAPVQQCSPQTLTLVFSKNILCSSIASNGTDFTVSGAQAVTVTGAGGVCLGGLTKTITLTLSKPISAKGTYQVTLVKGTDANTLLDECSQQTAEGSAVTFTVAGTASAVFNQQVLMGCSYDTVVLAHNGANGVNSWQWLFNDGAAYTTQTVTRLYGDYGIKTVKLVVSNGGCTDSSTQNIVLDNQLKAVFTAPTVLCPGDNALFTDSSIGKLQLWSWSFGNGATSNMQTPPQQVYPTSTGDKTYTARLIVSNGTCYDTAYQRVKILYTCYIAVPTAFTPNGDGNNDYLYPLNGSRAKTLQFRVYNRWGNIMFQTTSAGDRWNGAYNGRPQPAGVYVWYLNYTTSDGVSHFSKGSTMLLR